MREHMHNSCHRQQTVWHAICMVVCKLRAKCEMFHVEQCVAEMLDMLHMRRYDMDEELKRDFRALFKYAALHHWVPDEERVERERQQREYGGVLDLSGDFPGEGLRDHICATCGRVVVELISEKGECKLCVRKRLQAGRSTPEDSDSQGTFIESLESQVRWSARRSQKR
jgi:hypothetical protein